MKKLELFSCTSAVLSLIYFENASKSFSRNGGRFGYGSREGKGLGSKGQSCTLQIVENSHSADEKNRLSAEKLLNNISNCRNGVQTKVEKQARSMDRP